MSYRTILVYVNDSRHTAERVRLAAGIAMRFNAHLIGTAATALPSEFYYPGVVAEGAGLAAYLQLMKERAEGSLAVFEAQARKLGVASVEKRVVDDEAGSGVGMQARYCDLVVIGQADPDESLPDVRDDVPQYVVLNSGHPVLVVPYAGHFDNVGKRVLIAWDASMEATRAVTFSLPLLKQADVVQVVVFNPQRGRDAHGDNPGADIALYLARHGVKVEVSRQTTDTDIDIANALLSHAADFGADLLVMGGYGHSRFREVLLGGVTETILKSMTIPTLMAH